MTEVRAPLIMAYIGRGGGWAGERVIRKEERVVVADEMEHRPDFQGDTAGSYYKLVATRCAINRQFVQRSKSGN